MPETNHDDPYAFMVDLCRISSSQEQLLHRSLFVGDTANSHHGDQPPPSSGIVMVSLPETQDGGKDSSGPQDVFHTPPEESSLPTSDDQRRKVAVDRCAVNHAVDGGTHGFVDFCRYSESEGAEFVDLGRDSDLGFSEVQLTQGIDGDFIAECSRGVEGDGVGEISKCQFHEFGVLETELCFYDDDDLGQLPLKKLKLSEQNLGFGSLRDCFGVESQKVEEGMWNLEGKMKIVSEPDTEIPCNFGADLQPEKTVLDGERVSVGAGNEDNACGEISMDKNSGLGENVKTQVVQSETVGSGGEVHFCEADKLPCTVEGNKSCDEVIETSERQKRSDEEPGLRVLPSSIRGCLENAAKELESRGDGEEEKRCIFYVLKVLSEKSNEVEDSLRNVSLLEAAKLSGITFPCPRWWRDKDNYGKHRIV